MTLTPEQLTEARSKLINGSMPYQIVMEMSLQDITGPQLRKELIDAYGQEEIQSFIRTIRQNKRRDFSRLPAMIKTMLEKQQDLTITDCDNIINNLNAAITEVIKIKSDIDVTP